MARSIWKGSINFAMVVIPAKLYSATDDKRVSFHQIHGECGSRIQMPKQCPKCERKLEGFEIKKGYEVGDGHIILEETDFESLPLRGLKTVEVVEFVDGSQIDLRCFADCYFLTCEDMGAKAFRLFLTAMEQANLVAIAKLTYREREHLSAIRPYDGIMLLHTLHYADELRPYQDLKPREVALAQNELELATLKHEGAYFSIGEEFFGAVSHLSLIRQHYFRANSSKKLLDVAPKSPFQLISLPC